MKVATKLNFNSGIGVLAVLVTLAASVGCGGKGVVPVEAKVLLDGQPLNEASVTFIRASGEKGRAAFGITDSSGIVKLTTYEPLDGALPGNYTVVIIKAPENAHTYETVEDTDDVTKMIERSSMSGYAPKQRQQRVRTVIPKIYSKVNSTPLTCQVTNGGEQFTFELKSDAGD